MKNGTRLRNAGIHILLKSVKDPAIEKREKSFYESLTKAAHAIFQDLVYFIEKGRDPASDDVQSFIEKHYAFIKQIHHPSKEVYQALAQLYREHPAYRKQLDPFHPQLAPFMAKAMEIFTEREFS